MIEPIDSLNKIIRKDEPLPSPKKASAVEAKPVSAEPDEVSFNLDSAIDSVRAQTKTLGSELPQLIISALQSPQDESALKAPVDNVRQRLTQPLSFLLAGTPEGEVTPEALTDLESEIFRFRENLLAFKESEQFGEFFKDNEDTGVLENIVSQLSSDIQTTLDQIQSKI